MASVLQGFLNHVNGQNAVTQLGQAFAVNVTAGSRIIVPTFIAGAIAHTSTMVSDSLGTPFSLDHEVASAAGDLCFWSGAAPASGANTVLYNPGTSARLGIGVLEVSGIDAYAGGQTANASGTSTSAASGAITPAAANGIAIGYIQQANQVTWEADYLTGAGFNANGRLNLGYKLITATTSENAEGSFAASVAWQAMIIRYPDSAAPGATGWGRLLGHARNRQVRAA